MKITSLLYLLSNSPEYSPEYSPDSFIRHLDKPSCIHCKHYVPDLKETFSSGKCNRFGGKDLHTGDIIYDDANNVRQDESKCTVAGKYFVGEKKLLQKKAVYLVQQNLSFLLILATLFYMNYDSDKIDLDSI